MTDQTIGERIDSFIAYKRSLGYVYDTQARYLGHYRKYMEDVSPHLALPDKESTNRFLDKFQGQTGGLQHAMSTLREFSKYLYRTGYSSVYFIPAKQIPRLHPEPPHFFSQEEISMFFQKCDAYYEEHAIHKGRSLVFPAEFRLLYCCGLRPKEARMLLVKEVHLSEKYLDVTQSKGHKSRRIYISAEFASYLSLYDSRISSLFPGRIYFFPKDREILYSPLSINYNFKLVWNYAFPDWTGKLPRVYDFRHHFVWENINRWIREGTDTNAMLPYLMRYMGHSCLKDTLYYFRFVPDFYSDYRMLSNRLNSRIPEAPDE